MTTVNFRAGEEPRVRELYEEHRRSIYLRTDRVFAGLMPVQWIAAVAVALWISPAAWAGRSSGIHPHIWAALYLGGAITFWPVFCTFKWPGTQLTRQMIAVGQMAMSALLIHLCGGRIEAHFSIFGSLAFLAFYRDRRVLVTASLVVALDHFARGVYFPLSVFGTLTASPFRWLEHVGWVVFEDIFLMISIRQSLDEMKEIAVRQASLEGINATIRGTVAERTAELTSEIAEHGKLAGQLARERRRFEEILNNIPLMVFERCEDGPDARHYVSGYVEKMYGYTPREWTAVADFWLSRVHPEDKGLIAAARARAIASGEGVVCECRWIARDGRAVWGETHFAPLKDEGGRVIGMRGFTLDATARKDAEAAMEAMHRRLLDASRRAGMAEVATNVLHNVGNVLNSVNVSHLMICGQVRKSGIGSVAQAAGLMEQHADGLGEYLATDPIGKKIPAFLSKLAVWLAEEQAAILAELAVLGANIEHIKEIVAVQQCHAHASGLLEILPITGLIENALQINAASLAPHGIEIVREYADTPPAPLDKHKVMQILVNLIGNARDSLLESRCGAKRIVIRTGCDPGGISLSVTDNGIGIPRENLTRIFAHGFTTKKEGHGFGLHGSALAAMEMGGSLSVESRGPGHGATFLLKLPASPVSNAQAA